MRFNDNGNPSNKIYFLYDAIEKFYKLKNYYANWNGDGLSKPFNILQDQYLSLYIQEFLPLRLIAINPKLSNQKVEFHPASIDDFDEDDIIVIKLVFPEMGLSQIIMVEKDSDRMVII